MIEIQKIKDYYCITGKTEVLYSLHYNYKNSSYIEDNCLYFKSNKLEPLSKWKKNNLFSISLLSSLLHNAINQLIVLSELGKSYIGLNIEDIFIKDEKEVIIIPNDENIYLLDNKKKINIYTPFEKSYFTCPEIMNAQSLPIQLDFQCFFFIIGQLCIFCLYDENILKGNETIDNLILEKILLPIQNSSYYWCIKNSVLNNYKKRELILID